MAENSLTKVRVISRIGKDLGAVGDAFIKQCQARGVDVPNVDDIHARFAKQTMYSSAIAFLMDRGQEFASPSTDPWITDAVKSIHALTDWAIKATDARTKMAVDAKSST